MNYKLKTGFKKLCARAEGTNNANTNPAGIYLLKGNNRNTRTRCEICLIRICFKFYWNLLEVHYEWKFEEDDSCKLYCFNFFLDKNIL